MDEKGIEVWVDYPLVQEVEGVPETGYAPFYFSADGDYLLFRFTDETFTWVLSALQNGSKTTYPNNSFQVVWEFLKNVEFPVAICDLVAECFASDAEFRQTVIDALKSDPYFTETIQDLSGRSSGRQIEGELFTGDCDESVVAGRIIAIIDKLDNRNADFLEIVEVGTNDEERVSSVLAAIPGLGESPVDEIIDIIQSFLEDFTENYAAAITPDWLEEVYFDIWCATLQKPDCTLTFQDLFDYFNARVGGDLTVGATIQNVFSFIVNGDFSTDNLVASGMYLIQLAFILAGREFNGMSVPTIGALSRDASPSTAWMDWPECDTPPQPGCTEFTSEQGLWSPLDAGTTWENGEGYKGTFYAPVFYIAQIKLAPGTGMITRVDIYLNNAAQEVRLTNPDGTIAYHTYSGTPATHVEFSADTFPGWTNLLASTSIGFRVQWSNNDASDRIIEACVQVE